ncbi:family 43 glycosylhydrolase [Reichenbachiella ulvae]|uniref:Family 43 glycosylhydrolase n=1 Tax=Reichenbachiella ulvae TaxID=2980104 RepID=A0ABT3CSS9_9BACT|nr:family 43 glycosylhydrolase [Reichenbachiella ulvae]MCV9386699.1 family 43 glycosylhydrolase [Reichenbachiella ulvae]
MKHCYLTILLFTSLFAQAQNPIIPNQGINDPHIRVFNNKAYLSASHDTSIDNDKFIMEDWTLWSSDDLRSWKLESVLKPEDTYIGKPFSSCWATDIAYRNGKYYWYFSEGNQRAGVVVADSPTGPWTDPLGMPLLISELTPTHEYDMGIIETGGEYYLVFGVWDYYIARLNEDMISLAEAPRKIVVKDPQGPYGIGKLDDKPFIHQRNGLFYLSWGCFYAMSNDLYGPYEYKGTVIDSTSFVGGLESPTWPHGPLQGRHGSFFDWHNQSYFAYCDISQTGNRYFRDTFISYVHYKENGEMAVIRVDLDGVGQYDGSKVIQAEDYFESYGTTKQENNQGGFSVGAIDNGDYLIYPNIKGLNDKVEILIEYEALEDCVIEVRESHPSGTLLAEIAVKADESLAKATLRGEIEGVCLKFSDVKEKVNITIDSFAFSSHHFK